MSQTSDWDPQFCSGGGVNCCHCWSDLGLLPKERLLLTLGLQKLTGWWECEGQGGEGRLGIAAVSEGCLLL